MSQKEEAGQRVTPRHPARDFPHHISFEKYDTDREEELLPSIVEIVTKALSEPYSVYVYRYFLRGWPGISFLVSPCSPFPLSSSLSTRRDANPRLLPPLNSPSYIHALLIPQRLTSTSATQDLRHRHQNPHRHRDKQDGKAQTRHDPRLHRHDHRRPRLPRHEHSIATRPTLCRGDAGQGR